MLCKRGYLQKKKWTGISAGMSANSPDPDQTQQEAKG